MNHPSQPTPPAEKEVVLPTENAEPNRKENLREPEMKGAENADVPQEIIVTPPVEDEAYTLEAFGDISLSNIDFVPPPPTTLSPYKIPEANSPLKLPADGRASISGTYKRRSGYTHKIRAPSLSKARVDATEMTFESLVANYKHSREAPYTPGRTGGSRRAAVSEAVMQGPQSLLADLKNLGGGAVISAGESHDGVENSGYTKALVGSAVKCAAGRDENGAGAPGVGVAHANKNGPPLRGNARLPKRLPLPRWDDDRSWQSGTGADMVVSRYKLA